ncbi:DUF305 domain-containing protein [Actinoplanes teichomyceticus]|uniref:Uncharacterized protein (DUF305 family) n=1 Tax=Actinoplanes teichomyceticus TaxID=1867 RepID=A0A561VI65_ACTTI|nr:DUF305 domain-containing protein [Actinoplanes teichomyceticus]TWG11301.1 uncharacterized protein (DUF305 family) [Actinoplanes teichomyceticus]GIF16332.1 lipoprotein [Actinoplanes teichomyceticus]
MMYTSARSVSRRRRGLLAAAAAVGAAVLLAACGGGTESGMDHGGTATPTGTASAGVPAAGTHNDADVAFAQQMIPHHRQAVEMAAMADGRAGDARVTALAGQIRAAQQPEIDTMTGWLTAWGAPAPSAGDTMGDMHHDAMPGGMSESDMTALHNAKGAEFDKQFLTMMIEHHEGAVEMARTETAQGADPQAKALAQKIITAQQAEIATMKGILAQL